MAEIRVPTLGESVTEATIGKWFKKPGDAVAVDEPLVELETDKVTIEVPAPAAGVLSDIAAKDGDTVAVGAVLGQIKEGAGAAPAKAAPQPAAQPTPPPAPPKSAPAAARSIAASMSPLVTLPSLPVPDMAAASMPVSAAILRTDGAKGLSAAGAATGAGLGGAGGGVG